MYKDIMRGAWYIKNSGEKFDYIVYEKFMFCISKENENIVRVHVTADNYEEFVLDKECNSLMLDLILLPNK
jgi:hypothetical protein